MMRFLHCPTTPMTPEAIGELDDCKCWLCGFPMLTKTTLMQDTFMVKRVHGQVSPEHTLPIAAGNALIGLPTKTFLSKYPKKDKAEAIQFLKKGLTYSHFWCNEVKNALRLVTWPTESFPKPHDHNIQWLLSAMWDGIKREGKVNRWFDESSCFVIYTQGEKNYRFSNLVHYFALKARVDDITPAVINECKVNWIRNRTEAIRVFLQGVCDDIKRYTQIYFFQRYNRNPSEEEAYHTLQAIYKDRVMKGNDSTILWPPVSTPLNPSKRGRNTVRIQAYNNSNSEGENGRRTKRQKVAYNLPISNPKKSKPTKTRREKVRKVTKKRRSRRAD